jgi:hypothetical protein
MLLFSAGGEVLSARFRGEEPEETGSLICFFFLFAVPLRAVMNAARPALVLASARMTRHFSPRAFLPLVSFDKTTADQVISRWNNVFDEAHGFRVTPGLAHISIVHRYAAACEPARSPAAQSAQSVEVTRSPILHVSGPFCRTRAAPFSEDWPSSHRCHAILPREFDVSCAGPKAVYEFAHSNGLALVPSGLRLLQYSYPYRHNPVAASS